MGKRACPSGMSDIANCIEGILHEPTQIRDDGGVDLSLADVFHVAAPGRIDFGGGELTAAEYAPVETGLRTPEDEYRWWHLGPGQYVIAFNEELSESVSVTLQPRAELLERGAFHPTVTLDSLQRLPLSVGGAGVLLKENARVTTVIWADEG